MDGEKGLQIKLKWVTEGNKRGRVKNERDMRQKSIEGVKGKGANVHEKERNGGEGRQK